MRKLKFCMCVLCYLGQFLNFLLLIKSAPIPVAARSKAWVCGRSLAGIADSNPAGDMDVCLLWVLCVFSYKSLRRVDHSSRGVLPSVVCVSVWSWSLDSEENLASQGLWRHERKPPNIPTVEVEQLWRLWCKNYGLLAVLRTVHV
jgi:hypothetical protein